MTKFIKSLEDFPAVVRYLKRINAEVRAINIAAVKKESTGGYYKEQAKIRFLEDGTVSTKDETAFPTEQEQKDIKEAFYGYRFPKIKNLPSLLYIPEEIKDVPAEDIFEFRNLENQITMIQVKKIAKDGSKYYLPFTFWEDDEWRRVEPVDGLPLWGLENIKDNTTAFIHEGAKAAKAIQRMIMADTTDQKEKLKDHPWGQELCHAVHLGWVGGALSPQRTNWKMLNKLGIQQFYIVSDNDKAGISAVSVISQNLRAPTFHLQFTGEWPAAFDLADEFPEHMFKMLDNKARYIGPAFRTCLHPATWATDSKPVEGDKPIITLRDHFRDMWAYIEEADTFVCKPLPNIIREEKILNHMLAPFSHTPETSKMIFKAYAGRTTGLCYRPDQKEQIITNGNSSSINLHIPTTIKSEPGNPGPFLDYLKYMFPIDDERIGVERWIATLVARPDIRMEFALLLISEHTGIGKTTLGTKILTPLVNIHNVGFPREADIVDNVFNDWVSNKRLIIINEIYSGHSWKAYHTLKSLITDKEISVNQKYQRPYVVDNWSHILACSNSMRALKLEGDDRRWFYPEVVEERWTKSQFGKFRDWLESGGLGIIKHWADGYGNYVMPGERAPMTARKREMIEGSRSDGQQEAVGLAEALAAYDRPAAIAMKDIIGSIRNNVQGKVFDTDYEIRKVMLEAGVYALGKRLRIHGRMQYVIVNNLLKILIGNNPDKIHDLVMEHLLPVNKFGEEEI